MARHVRERAAYSAQRARRARRQAAVLLPLIVGVFLAYKHREQLFGVDLPVRVAAVLALVVLGWAFARDAGRALAPTLFGRMDPGTAGTVGFLVRLVTLVFCVLIALRIAGLHPRTLAVGGAITAVIVGLAAQQTIGNLIAGTVLLSARPFRVGDRIRLHAGGLAGQAEGPVVTSLGLLYTTLAHGADRIMVPNSVVLSAAVVPLREPSGVDVRVRLPASVRPSALERHLAEAVTVATRSHPHIALEEIDEDGAVLRVSAAPASPEEGSRLADQVLAALVELTSAHAGEPALSAR